MVKEEHVKELFQMAVYDKNQERANRPMGEYYRNDYVGKETLKSFFTGTFAYMICFALWVLYRFEDFLNGLISFQTVELVIEAIVLYLVFIAVYLIVTSVVYNMRYREGRQKLREYYVHLKHVNREYERESRQK